MNVPKHVGGVILASGMSRRFEDGNKLLARVGGTPVVRRVAGAYLDAGLEPVVVVAGYQAEEVTAALLGLRLTMVHNPHFEQGQSRALVAGVRSLPDTVEAAVIGVADQPFLHPSLIRRLVSTWQETGAPVVAPLYDGERGNPILYTRTLFPELLEVTGDRGGRPVFHRHQEEAVLVAAPDPRAGRDIDTVEDLRGLK